MSDAASKRFGMPGAKSSPLSNSSPHVNLSISRPRARPFNQRVSSSTTIIDEAQMNRVSLDSMGGNNIDHVMGIRMTPIPVQSKATMTKTLTTVVGPTTPQRIKLQRSFTSPMQFESSDIEYTSSSSSSIKRRQLTRHIGTSTPQREERSVVEGIDESRYINESERVEATSEEYVVALHDFTSSNSTCLSFEAGQVIRVFNRDQSGWWDGELNGERGWFPSNYVDEDGITSSMDNQSIGDISRPKSDLARLSELPSLNQRTLTSTAEHRSNIIISQNNNGFKWRSPTPTANTYLYSNRGNSSILDPIYHAISLLHNAVRANRVAHFQPSTACVISSVRSVLSATDCLTRESIILKAHPILAKERKQILAELSKLVSQARKASSPMVDESDRDQEMEIMLSLSDLVLRNVRRFLEVAIECDVSVPNRRSSVYDDLYEDRNRIQGSNNLFSPSLDRSDQDKTPTPESPQTFLYRSNAYQSNSRSSTSHSFYSPTLVASPEQHLRPTKSVGKMNLSAIERGRSDSLQSDMQEASSSGDHSIAASCTGTGSGSGSASRSEYGSGTSPSDSCDSLTDDSPSNGLSLNSSSGHKCTPSQVLDRLQTANDQLLSVIAAYIGHIHSHTRKSHASSYAFLIDMTRATVDGVRSLLVVVEAVHNSVTLQAEIPGQMTILWETRESVYEATAALVTAARIITSTTIYADGTASSSVFANEEDEKAKLLQSATSVLRTGGECVGAVKMCLNRARADLTIFVPSQMTSQQSQGRGASEGDSITTSPIEEDEEEGLLSKNGISASQFEYSQNRGKQTLSLLGRKATSLSCLREKYEQDASLQQQTRIMPSMLEEDDRGEYIEEMRGTIRSKKSSRNTEDDPFRRFTGASIEGSESSGEPMSRHNSRTSGSTLQSIQSDSTAETSARPSFDQSEVPRPNTEGHRRIESQIQHDMQKQHQIQQHSPISPIFPMTASTISFPPDHAEADICFNSEGQLTGATLQVLVERMTPHDTTIDANFSSTFFLCFRLFTSPMELFETLEGRYKMRAPVEIEMDAEQLTKWMETKAAPVRLRVFNFLKMWLETHWNESSDCVILEKLIQFTQTSMTHTLHRPAQRLAEIAHKRLAAAAGNRGLKLTGKNSVSAASNGAAPSRPTGSLMRMMSTDRIKMSGASNPVATANDTSNMYPTSLNMKGMTASMLPTPIISKGLLTNLRNNVINGSVSKIGILEFDLLELARQLTIMESKIYCSIMPQELLGQEFSKKVGVSSAINVKKMSALSNSITGWISECILNEVDAKKRTNLVKYFIKLGDRCLTLNNFNTLMAIQCALNSSTISRLKKTWDGLPAKHRLMMENQRRCVEHTRNFANYRQTLRETIAPALPFVGLFLTDLTFCHEGNASTRPSPMDPKKKLLNFDKYVKMSRIIGDLQRFQVAYDLVEVPEIQMYLQTTLEDVQRAKGAETADDLYRRSLLLEPRRTGSHNDAIPQPSPATISIGMTRGNGSSSGESKLGLDLFNWK